MNVAYVPKKPSWWLILKGIQMVVGCYYLMVKEKKKGFFKEVRGGLVFTE